MSKRHAIPDAQVAAFLKHYQWLLHGKPRERLAYRIIERQREEISRLRMELDALNALPAESVRWTDKVSGER
jgi:hypothetical protein